MILEEGLFDHLKTHVNAHIYAQLRGDKLPAVVYSLTSRPIEVSLSDVDQIRESRYQIDCYHRKYIQVKQLAQQVISALHHYSGSLGGCPVQRVYLEDQRDGFEEMVKVNRQILAFVIYHY